VRIARGEPDVSISLAPLHERLAETSAWCAPRADPAHPRTSLRSAELAPGGPPPDSFAGAGDVAARRRAALDPAHPPRAYAGGRLMVYFPDATLEDGAAEVESRGFFDVRNTPPWDTWVGAYEYDRPGDACFAAYLVAWVPPAFVELAARGIEVNPERCIAWLDETERGLRSLPEAASPLP